MRSASRFCGALLLAACSLVGADLRIRNDRAMPVYRCGEPAEFTVSAEGADASGEKFTVEFLRDGRDGDVAETRTVELTGSGSAKVSATLKEPGFLLARLCDARGKVITRPGPKGRRAAVLAGAAFEPEKIRMAYALPADFSAFWETGRQAVVAHPVKLEKVPKFCTPAYTAYYVTVDCLDGEKITGYLTVPTGRGPFPAYITVPGAGPGIAGPDRQYADKGVITLAMNVHKFPTAEDAKEQKARYEADVKLTREPYLRRGAQSRETYFLRNSYLGIDRMASHIAAMPEWDRKHMVIYGSSQGGGTSFVIAGLNKNITAFAANVPGFCDQGGSRHGRTAGGSRFRDLPEADRSMPYFDAGNFARFVKIPALVSCGFIDRTCSPGSVYAAFNELGGEKEMVHMPREGHSISKAFQIRRDAFVRRHLGLEK